jgi:hypothetical protein
VDHPPKLGLTLTSTKGEDGERSYQLKSRDSCGTRSTALARGVWIALSWSKLRVGASVCQSSVSVR